MGIEIGRVEKINNTLISYKLKFIKIRTYVYKNTNSVPPKEDIGRHLSIVIRKNSLKFICLLFFNCIIKLEKEIQ